MVFTQHININNIASSQKFMRICSEHLGCKDCPLQNEDIQLQGGLVRCVTGRENAKNNQKGD